MYVCAVFGNCSFGVKVGSAVLILKFSKILKSNGSNSGSLTFAPPFPAKVPSFVAKPKSVVTLSARAVLLSLGSKSGAKPGAKSKSKSS